MPGEEGAGHVGLPLAAIRSAPLAELTDGDPLPPHLAISVDPFAADDSPPVLIYSGKVGRCPAALLIDSGASYNFIADSYIAKHRLTTTAINGPTIQLADGTLYSVTRQLTGTVRIGAYLGKFTAFALPLQCSYDVILGTPWLTATNPHIDWRQRTITVQQHGQSIVLRPTDLPHQPKTPYLSTLQVYHQMHRGAILFLAIVREKVPPPDSTEPPDDPTQTNPHHTPDQDSPSTPTDYPPEIQAAVDQHVRRLKQEYADVMPPELPKELPPHRPGHDFKIELVPGAKPFKGPYYKLSYEEEAECRRQCEDGMARGFVRPSTSPWGSPVLFVKKKDGTLRMCIDYRALNKLTIKNNTALPRIDDLLDRMAGARYFTTMDLRSGYNQMRVEESSIPFTAFKTKWGLFEYTVLSFGLCNAPASFQALMTDIFRAYLDQWLVIFIDDLCAWDSDLDTHIEHLEIILSTLREHKLYIKETKCEWIKPEVSFLGHRISKDGVSMDDGKVQAILDWPAPSNVAELRSFLGMAGFYRHFLRRFAQESAVLTDLLRKDQPWTWTERQQAAFDNLKHKLTTAPVLAYPDPAKPFTVTSDASSRAIGAVLTQDHGRGQQPIAFFSRKLNPTELNFAAYELELLALIEALKHWRHYLRGASRNQAFTDHRALKFFAAQKTLNPRQARWMGILQEYNVYIDYLPGKTNLVADALSRRPDLLSSITTVHTLGEFLTTLKASYGNDDESKAILTDLQNGTAASYSLQDGLILQHDSSHRRLYIPPAAQDLRRQLLAEHHDSVLAGHLGYDKTVACLQRNYWWPTMRRDVRAYIGSCPCCQVNKGRNRRSAGLLQPLPIPERQWESTSMDFITHLPTTADGNDAIMTVVDRLTKMVHVVPTRTTATAPDVAALYFNTITRLHGLQKSIISDRDPKFTSKFWEALAKLWDTRLNRSTAFHPQTDGQTERANRVLQEVLRAYVSDRHTDWDKRLAAAEFAINNAPSASTGESPFYLNYGFHPLTPATVDLPTPDNARSQAASEFVARMNKDLAAAKAALKTAQERQAHYANTKRQDISYKVGDRVLLSTANLKLRTDGPASKFNPRWCGPFAITERIGKVAYRLELPSTMRVHPVFHVSLLKPYQAAEADDRPAVRPPPIIGEHIYEAERISNRRTVTVNGRQQVQYLVHWQGYPDSEATWEPASHLLGKTCKAWRKAVDTALAETGRSAIQAAGSSGSAPSSPQPAPRRRNSTSVPTAPSSPSPPAPPPPAATPPGRYNLRPRR